MDRRVRRTRRLLGEAFIALLQTDDFYSITIRDITERADVAYSTFFRNFESKEDLLLTYLHDFVADLQKSITVDADATYRQQTRQSLAALFAHVQQHPQMHRTLLTTPAAQPVLDAFKRDLVALNQQMFTALGQSPRDDAPPLDLVFDSSAAQLFSLVAWWLAHDCEASVETLVGYAEQLMVEPMWRVLLDEAAMRALLDS